MFPSRRSFLLDRRVPGLIVLTGAMLVSCGHKASRPPAAPPTTYDRAKEAFKNGQLIKALELTDELAHETPPADSSERAKVLRAVIYAGELKGAFDLSEAFGQGAERSRNPQYQAVYRRLHHDSLFNAAKAALDLVETAHQLAPGGVMPKELTLEADFPTAEGPGMVRPLVLVQQGGWIERDQQEAASADAMRKGIDDALADVVSGGRAKAREAMAKGSVQLEGAAFAIFLAKELAGGAPVFDQHHARDPQNLTTLCDQGDVLAKAALALMKDSTDKNREREARKLQAQFKTLRKDT